MREASSFPRFSADEMAQRHAQVHALMEEASLDGLLFYGSGRFATEIYWLTDWPGSREAYILFQPGREPVVLAQLYNHIPMARVLSVVSDVRWAGPNTAEAVVELLHERGLEGKRVGLVGSLPHQQYERLRESISSVTFVDVGGKHRMRRTIHSAEEIARYALASKLTDDSIQALANALRPGLREDELPAILENVYLRAGGYAGIHFMTSMPMEAPTFPVPAQYQSDRMLQPGDCLITEISGAYWGYSGQIHRTYSLGQGPTPAWRDLHDAAVETFLAIVDVLQDGVSTREIEGAAEVVHRRGYSIYDDLLHGVNQSPPIIQTASTKRHTSPEVIFREGMVITVQPNVITRDERMGLQFGETVVVRKDGVERLNQYPREWITVEC